MLLGRKGRWSLEVDVRKTVGRPGSASHCSCPISLELLLHKVGHILIFAVGGHDLKILSILWPPLTTEPPSRSTSGAKESPIQHLLRCGKSTATFILWEGQFSFVLFSFLPSYPFTSFLQTLFLPSFLPSYPSLNPPSPSRPFPFLPSFLRTLFLPSFVPFTFLP